MGSLKWWRFAPVVVALAFVADFGVSASISNERLRMSDEDNSLDVVFQDTNGDVVGRDGNFFFPGFVPTLPPAFPPPEGSFRPGIQCPRSCPTNASHVCATNGRTFLNECFLRRASCRDSSIDLLHEGNCTVAGLADDVDIGDESSGRSGRRCPRRCPWRRNRVCATNGVTYRNRCYLRRAACRNSTIEYLHRGRCRPSAEDFDGFGDFRDFSDDSFGDEMDEEFDVELDSTEREEQLTPLPHQSLCRFAWYRRLYPRRCRWFSEADAEESDEFKPRWKMADYLFKEFGRMEHENRPTVEDENSDREEQSAFCRRYPRLCCRRFPRLCGWHSEAESDSQESEEVYDREEQNFRCRFRWYRILYPRRCRRNSESDEVSEREEQSRGFIRAMCRFAWYRRLHPRCLWRSEADADESDEVGGREEQFNRALCVFAWYRRLYPRRCRSSSEAAEESDEDSGREQQQAGALVRAACRIPYIRNKVSWACRMNLERVVRPAVRLACRLGWFSRQFGWLCRMAQDLDHDGSADEWEKFQAPDPPTIFG